MFQAIRQNWKNWTGTSLAIIHAITLTWLIFAKTPLPPSEPCPPDALCLDPLQARFAGVSIIAGRDFHFAYETLPLQFLMLADIPGMLVGTIVTSVLWLPMEALQFSALAISYVMGFVWVIFGSLQWWLIGTIAEIKLSYKWKRRHG